MLEIKSRIFIVGCPRSGTTLLQGLLSSHPKITSFKESHFFDYGIKRPKNSGFYYLNANVETLIHSFLEENDIGYALRDKIQKSAPSIPYLPGSGVKKWTEYFIRILDSIALERGKTIWIEKTPDHLNRIKIIERYSINTAFFHIVRDGRDVVASLYRASQQWGKNYSVKQCINFWNKAIKKSLNNTNNPNHHFIHYDDLIADYMNIINNTFEYFQLSKIPDIEAAYGKNINSVIGKNESWKDQNYSVIEHQSKFESTFNNEEKRSIELALDWEAYNKLLTFAKSNSISS